LLGESAVIDAGGNVNVILNRVSLSIPILDTTAMHQSRKNTTQRKNRE
jgi:aspartate/glutamate racemase